jgi:hypothetical protein
MIVYETPEGESLKISDHTPMYACGGLIDREIKTSNYRYLLTDQCMKYKRTFSIDRLKTFSMHFFLIFIIPENIQ